MDILAETLDEKLHEWKPHVAEQVRQYIREIIDLADQDTIDLIRSRTAEQEVLDIIDAP